MQGGQRGAEPAPGGARSTVVETCPFLATARVDPGGVGRALPPEGRRGDYTQWHTRGQGHPSGPGVRDPESFPAG
eukprot:402977-Lingulodinium_polyedra.AAC.1